jgi:ATP adenylyltransferase
MKYIWSPWRMKYILHHEKAAECIFCRAVQKEDGVENLIVARQEHAFLIMNRYPYTSGHLMVVPYEHVPSYEQLDPLVRASLMELITDVTRLMRRIYSPQGFNLGANIGEEAGAGIAGHVHFHIVPRWGGDTNFMTALADTRVLPESLPATYRRLQAGWKEMFG